ncbi:hypothetical protein B0T11DRAFT_293871 [Plectosphaerella cucumerina]|uniref:Uncharacterized protein n=1 Tax=Plectosphaerella cucumerina TaxID=40658 RepID=A0A8K0TQ49_9PEZI|nr:hypothetical protein B0T11DRAFT_293871 [Plectosphaerella cucumerina]
MAASSDDLQKIIQQAEKDLNTYQAKTGAAREQYDDPAGVRSLNEKKFPGAEVKYQGDDLSTNASWDKRIPPSEGGDLDDRGRQATGGQYDHHEGRGDPQSLAKAKFNENPGQNDGDVVNTTLGGRVSK